MLGFTVCIFSQVEPKRISNAEVKQILDQKKEIVIVDVRGINAYKSGHIPTSISMSSGEIVSRHKELPKNKLIVLYCSWIAEASSVRAAQILAKDFGFNMELLKVLKGGFHTWRDAGYPVNQGLAVKPKGKLATLWSKIRSKK